MSKLSMIRKLSFTLLMAMNLQAYATNTISIELQKLAQGDWSVEYKTSQLVKRIFLTTARINHERSVGFLIEVTLRLITTRVKKAFAIKTASYLAKQYSSLPQRILTYLKVTRHSHHFPMEE